MANQRPKTCRYCHKHEDEIGHVSWRGKCLSCGRLRLNGNHEGMLNHDGPHWRYWRERMAASVGAVLPGRDDG